MIRIDEALQLTIPPQLSFVTPATRRIFAWCRLHGVSKESLAPVELPLVEALNNAVKHGCAGNPNATVRTMVRVTPEAIIVAITDPSKFTPPANWSQLPEDPLAESGRGGFLIHQGTNRWEHSLTAGGHTLTLHWNATPLAGQGLEAAADAESDIHRLTADLANSFETLLGLTHFAGLLATSASFEQLLKKVHERLRTMLAHDSLLIRFVEGNQLIFHPLGENLPVPLALSLSDNFAESICATHHRPLVGGRADLSPGDPLAAFAARVCVLIVEFGGKTLGTFAASRRDDASAFSAGEVELLQAVADFIGIAKATDNLWRERNQQLRLEQEIAVAAGIQRSLLPATFPSSGRWWVHGDCRPAREVGGDYFDVVPLPDGSLLLLIADVMGKGVPASLLAAMLRSTLRALAAVKSSPGAILTGINQQLFADLASLGMFITAVLVKLPAAGETMSFFGNAGHCAPAIIRPDGRVQEFENGDAPLGVLPDTGYQDYPLPINLGDRLVLYTDGCYELPGPDRINLLGVDRYLGFAATQRQLTPPNFVSALLDPTAFHLDPSDITDDRTLLVASLRS